TLDTTSYEKLRLWRWPNTINSKTRLYKVPLTVEELLALDLTAIKRLAVSPRQIEWPPDDEWQVNPELQALWMGTPEPTIARPARLGTQADDDGQKKILKGNRNARLTSLAGTMRRRGMGEAAIAAALLETNAAQCEPPLDEAEVRRIATSVARYQPSEPDAHDDVERARGIVTTLSERAKTDKTAAFEPETLGALALVKEEDPAEWMRTREELKKQGILVSELDRAVKDHKKKQQKQRHL